MISNRELYVEAWAIVDAWMGDGELAIDQSNLEKLTREVEDSLRQFYNKGFEAGRAQGRAEAASESEGE